MKNIASLVGSAGGASRPLVPNSIGLAVDKALPTIDVPYTTPDQVAASLGLCTGPIDTTYQPNKGPDSHRPQQPPKGRKPRIAGAEDIYRVECWE